MEYTMKLLIRIPFLALFFIPAFAEEQSYEQCVFTGHIQKSWATFGERPWITGFVYNCDDNIEYHLKDFVHWQINHLDGKPVDGGYMTWKPIASERTLVESERPSKYKGIDDVFRGYGIKGANADTTEAKTYYLHKNQYFFYLPQIHSIDFEHRGIYYVEISYGNHIEKVYFAVLDPNKWWQDS